MKTIFSIASIIYLVGCSSRAVKVEDVKPEITQKIEFKPQEIVVIGKPNMSYIIKLDSALALYNIKHTFAGCDVSSPEAKVAMANNENVMLEMKKLLPDWDERFQAIRDSIDSVMSY